MKAFLEATRDAFELVREDPRRGGLPGYRVKGIPNQARPRPDFKEKNLHIARPLFPKDTGGPYSDPFGLLEGTRARPGIQATPRSVVESWSRREGGEA